MIIPSKWDDLDFYDKKFVEDYMCKRLAVFYKSAEVFDSIGISAWSEQFLINFPCEML